MKLRFYKLVALIILGLVLASEGTQAMNASKRGKIYPYKYMKKIAEPKILKNFYSSTPKSYLKIMEEWAAIKKLVNKTPCHQFFKYSLREVENQFLKPCLFLGYENYLIKLLEDVREMLYQERSNLSSLNFTHKRITNIIPLLEILIKESNLEIKEEILILLNNLKDDKKSFNDLIKSIDSIIYAIENEKYHLNYY
jgi:hypothetical protein